MSTAIPFGAGVGGVTIAQTIALVPPSIVAALWNPISYTSLLVAALITVFAWETIFSTLRKHPPSFHGITTVLIVMVLVPPDVKIWQLVIALSLGIVLGELIFGGRGFGFLSPAVVTLSLLLFSFPQFELPQATPALAFATLPAALLFLYLGLIAWRVILGVVAGLIAMLLLNNAAIDAISIVIALSFCLVFLVCDPTAASATNPGRWIYGLLVGYLVILFSGDANINTQAIVFATLMTSITAPLIDHLVVLVHTRRWRDARD